MTKREAIEWLKTIKVEPNKDIHTGILAMRREALDMAIRALETVENLEKWMDDMK